MDTGLQNLFADMSAGFGDAAEFINRIWVDWKIGPVMAVLSMVMVFTRDYGLIKDFVKSDSKLKKWPKLALYTSARVCMSVAAYHGPVWVLEWIIWFFEMVWGLLVECYKFLSGVDQAFVMHGTTAVILIAFLSVTIWAIREWFLKKFCRDGKQPGVQAGQALPPAQEPDVSFDEPDSVSDWESLEVSRKKAWRRMSLKSRIRILSEDGKQVLSKIRGRLMKKESEFPDVDSWRKVRQDLQSLPTKEESEDVLPVFPKLEPGARIPAKTGQNRSAE